MPKIMPSNNPIVAVDPNPMGMVYVHSSAFIGLKSTSYPALSFFASFLFIHAFICYEAMRWQDILGAARLLARLLGAAAWSWILGQINQKYMWWTCQYLPPLSRTFIDSPRATRSDYWVTLEKLSRIRDREAWLIIEIDRPTGADPEASTRKTTPAIMPWSYPLAYTYGRATIHRNWSHPSDNKSLANVPWLLPLLAQFNRAVVPKTPTAIAKSAFIGFYDFANNSRKVFIWNLELGCYNIH